MDNSLNTARAILVAGAVVAVLVMLATGQWVPAVVLTVAIAAHAGLWIYLRRDRGRHRGVTRADPDSGR